MDVSPLRLDTRQLIDVAATLADRIREGLALHGREIKALPAFLPPPPPGLSGEALVVDAGGTNVRAAHVRLGGDGDRILAGPVAATLPVRGSGHPMSADTFWSLQAELTERAGIEKRSFPVGYCFSYPSEVHQDRDATLLTWTKGVDIDGVEGRRVGAPLAAALAHRGYPSSGLTVLNDTVAALLGGSGAAPDPERVIGLIAGTGTNMAAYFRPSAAPKLSPWEGPMAVNLESGNFTPPFLTAADDAFDARGDKQGQQRFEKAVSGYALPHLFLECVSEAGGFDPARGTGQLVEIRSQGGPSAEVAAALLDRSADLIAAGLVGVARVLGGSAPITVLAEGGLISRAAGYQERVAETLAQLQPEGPQFLLAHRNDVNLYGSAAAALCR